MTEMFRRFLGTISPTLARRQMTPSMKPINLLRGWPSVSLLPKQELAKAAGDSLLGDADVSDEQLEYGPDPGSQIVRESVGDWLTKFYKPIPGAITHDRIFIGNGASASLGIILEKFTDPVYTRYVWMIEPTYFMACPIFEDAGFEGRLRGVPEDDEGINVEFLQEQISKADDDAYSMKEWTRQGFKSEKKYPKLYRHVIYVVPTFSNPSGKVMSMRRRRELIELARRHDALVITDDVYDMLRWPTDPKMSVDKLSSPPPRLVDIDRELRGCTEYGNTCSNGSFSKIVAPGVRCSWVEGTPALAYALSTHGYTRSGGCPSQMASIMIESMLKSGALNKHLETQIIPTYQKRYAVMMDAIKTHLEPLGVRVTGGLPVVWNPEQAEQVAGQDIVAQAGGFFCYIMFPKDLPMGEEIARISLKNYGVRIGHGRLMVVAGDESSLTRCHETFGHGARLSWAWCTAEEIREGVERLATVLSDIKNKKVGDSDGTEVTELGDDPLVK